MTIKKIHQIWIADDNSEPSDYIKNQMQRVKNKYFDYKYIFWDNNSIIEFLSKNFDKSVLDAYQKVKAYAFKADLARYCILYNQGGIYIDSALRPKTKIDFVEPLIIAEGISCLIETQNKYLLENNFIVCNQLNHHFLKKAIEICVINILDSHYHEHPLEVTGPIMLGSIEDKTDVTIVKVIKQKTLKITYINDIPYLDHKKPRLQADLSKLNCVGTNNYEEMWFKRTIY